MAVITETLFREAMTHLASGVAVITARRDDGHPCGLAATSVASYSAVSYTHLTLPTTPYV